MSGQVIFRNPKSKKAEPEEITTIVTRDGRGREFRRPAIVRQGAYGVTVIMNDEGPYKRIVYPWANIATFTQEVVNP